MLIVMNKMKLNIFLNGSMNPELYFPRVYTSKPSLTRSFLVMICTGIWYLSWYICQIGLSLPEKPPCYCCFVTSWPICLVRQPCRPSVRPNYVSLTEFNYNNLENLQLLPTSLRFRFSAIRLHAAMLAIKTTRSCQNRKQQIISACSAWPLKTGKDF